MAEDAVSRKLESVIFNNVSSETFSSLFEHYMRGSLKNPINSYVHALPGDGAARSVSLLHMVRFKSVRKAVV